MDASGLTREHCVQVLCQVAAETNRKQGEAEAARQALLEDSSDERHLSRVCNTVVRKLAAAGKPLSPSVLRRSVASKDRGYFEPAIDRLLGTVIAADTESSGKASVSYRLIGEQSP
jgi:hypothetical protein